MSGETLLVLGAAVTVFFFLRGGAGGGAGYMAAGLICQTYTFSDNPDERVRIEARQSGLIGRIFTMLGLAASYKIIVTNQDVRISTTGKLSDNEISVPILSIGGVFYGYVRPKWALLLGIALALSALFMLIGNTRIIFFSGFVGAVLVGALAAGVLYFLFWKAQVIEVRVASEGVFWGYNFFNGLEGSSEKARMTYQVINTLIYKTKKDVL